MSHEIVIGLNVTDDREYQRYRNAMRPILESYNGRFVYDFRISEVLASETENEINRVFTINFPSNEKMDEFFADPDYRSVRDKHFNRSVSSTTLISSYEKDA